ncbi:MAG TPA: hypothetical protein PLE48_10375 [Thiobacillus sp.]|nr:MAG: hypothetical protein B7Y50_10485 [Hydrogenophilales bacterium 28-61-11]OYZ57503.1 MAG: hypothetical protein B7Y21_07220 [Hydrogenophilales bacterium 16-61-112]OZA44974.1 MAG: hypothetical protein B7X81_09065 [Hydrogenophilales bacterium 17-61-76]HQT30507.1 hypothetical protein [Thiobacillus sp.]HQT70818.1 hypothetical protein [Thiobacillus sp.]
MSVLEWLEAASYIVTIVGLPLAIGVYVYDRRRDRQNDEEEIFLRLADEYADFMRLVIDNADLHLLSPAAKGELSEEQLVRKHALFAILVSLFERAYVLVYEDRMSRQQARLWTSWEDYMTEWCAREDFRAALPTLLQGEDPGFVATIRQIAGGVASGSR